MEENIVIDAQRVYIRRFRPTDAEDLYDYLSREEVVRFEPYPVFTRQQCDMEAAERSDNYAMLAVCLKSTNKVIGNLYFEKIEPENVMTWELGYVFNSDYWNKGYANEACSALLEYAFNTLGAHRIVAMCNPKNVASWKLLERLKFRREGHLVKNMYFNTNADGKPMWNDTYTYAMLGVEYLVRKYHEYI